MINKILFSWFLENISKASIRQDYNSSLSKLTVVIPSYERHEYLLRAIVFWANSPAQIIIVDGSKKCLPIEVKKAIGPLQNILYIHNRGGVSQRFALAAQHIATEYVINCCDDEYFLQYGLDAAVKKLDKNQDAIGCIGQSIRFNSTIRARVQYGIGYPHEDYSICQKFVGDRLTAAFQDYNAATCYAILRSDVWAKSFNQVYEYSSAYVSEIQQAFLTYTSGKFISENCLYWLRSFDVAPMHHNNEFNRKLWFSEWWTYKKYADERLFFVNRLTKELLRNGIKTDAEAQKMVEFTIELYLNFENFQRFKCKNFFQKIFDTIRSFVRNHTSLDTIDVVNRVLRRYKSYHVSAVYNFGTLEEFVEKNWDGPYGLNKTLIDELQSIENTILQFNKIINFPNSRVSS